MIIGRNQFIISLLGPEYFQCAIGDHLIGVHVHGSAGATLNAVHHELILPFTVGDFFRRLHDGAADLRRHPAGLQVGPGGGGFNDAQRRYKVMIQFIAGDIEVMHGPRRLYPIIQAIRDLNFPQKIFFNSHVVLPPPRLQLFCIIGKRIERIPYR